MLPSAVPKARIMAFGYDSMWLGRNPLRTNLWIIANNLLGELALKRKVSFRFGKSTLTRPEVSRVMGRILRAALSSSLVIALADW